MKTVFEVVDSGMDGWERHTVAFFAHKKDAETIRSTKTSYGQGTIAPHKVFDSIEDFETNSTDSKIRKAKSKLTPEELELLGIE